MKNESNVLPKHDNFRAKALKGFLWAFFDAVSLQGVQFIILLILARILQPAEFGLIAMLTIFISLAYSFIDSGYSSALIQKKEATYVDESSIFYFTILIGVITSSLFWFFAPWIADFYNEPSLTSLARVLSITLFIDSLGITHYTLMKKAINFKLLTKISLIASVLSGIIGIIMAFNKFGVWSLVVYTFSNKLFRLILYWIYNSWRPGLIFSITSLRSMFSYGSNILFIGLLETIFKNIYTLIIGKYFSAADLGYYSRAKSLQQIPVDNISGIISRVTFPIFSKLQDDKVRLKMGFKKIIASTALITFPTMIVLCIVAKPLVIVLITSKWLPSVPYLQLLCGFGLTYPLIRINFNILKAIGLSGLLFKIELFIKALIGFSILITYQWGIEIMIKGHIIVSLLSYLLSLYYTARFIDYSMTQQIKDLLPIFFISFLMGCVIISLSYFEIENQLLLLITSVLTGFIFYIIFCHIFKISAYLELLKQFIIK
jgi:teichuronic acid exporter